MVLPVLIHMEIVMFEVPQISSRQEDKIANAVSSLPEISGSFFIAKIETVIGYVYVPDGGNGVNVQVISKYSKDAVGFLENCKFVASSSTEDGESYICFSERPKDASVKSHFAGHVISNLPVLEDGEVFINMGA
jgi:hypothetical protein